MHSPDQVSEDFNLGDLPRYLVHDMQFLARNIAKYLILDLMLNALDKLDLIGIQSSSFLKHDDSTPLGQ